MCRFDGIVPVGNHASAAAFDIRPNCDLRMLELNAKQRERLQLRRQQYKDQMRQIQADNRRRKDVGLHALLAKPPFDRHQAGKIAQERYTDDIKLTVAELNFYHDLFQMLDQRQRELWLDKCVGDTDGRR